MDAPFDAAHRVLAVSAAALAASSNGAPSQQFVAHGRPADDCCDAVAVYVERIRPTITFPSTAAALDVCDYARWAVDLAIHVVRGDAPVIDTAGNFPTAAAMQAHAHTLAADLEALRLGLRKAHAGRTLLADRDAGVVWGTISPYGPRGGCAGWDMRLTAEVYC